MIVTDDERLAALCRSIRSHGRPHDSTDFTFERFGFNSKMNDLEAALGCGSLASWEQTFSARKRNLNRLLELTRDLEPEAQFMSEAEHEVVSPHAFPLVLKDPARDRDALYAFLEGEGIQCKTLFGSLPTQQPAFAWLGHQEGEFPVAERVGRGGLHFGVHEGLSEEDLLFVSDRLHAWFGANA